MTTTTDTNRTWLFTNASVLDPDVGTLHPDRRVLVTDGVITEVGGSEVSYRGAETIDLHGRTLMPGLIDAHVHVTAATADLSALPRMAPSYTTLHAAAELNRMLRRGFTSVRDCGGADHGLAAGIRAGLIQGPRLHYAGKALSQTGGHGDVRHPGDDTPGSHYCCPDFGRVCDGISECRRAARDELRKGATHLKIMLSGGATSPTDRIDSTQFSVEEIRAIVEEARAANRYAAGHAYTPEAIARGVTNGVRSIEHGNFIDDATAALFREHDAFIVPTLVTYHALSKEGAAAGLSDALQAKVSEVLEASFRGLETAHRNGINIAFGSDLLGSLQDRQLDEFTLRTQVQEPVDVIRSATVVGARLLQADGRLGIVAPGAHADLLVVDGNPLEDITALTDSVHMVMAGGSMILRSL
ncbi:possible amidohydrolase (plasmid) [Rhodococcus jostii RHA1]|uniref:Possible amidohydrolase n=1 Tax=Rhodococcus jostii (strain RHA1) TaxID=101510 RepID=Q0RXZ3_RHOJR|nr:amidohydrolase family protein [Rhodococcus jostii]ABG99843.1 possible amidohydrolase [Rhodococcus jostii RHA1]